MYVSLALRARFAARCTTSIPSTSGLYTLYHISTPTRVSWPRSRMAVSTPRRRMLMHTPANGSPVRWRTSRMSPSLALSGFSLSKRRVRAPVGSRVAREAAVTVETGVGQVFLIAGAGATMLRPWVLSKGGLVLIFFGKTKCSCENCVRGVCREEECAGCRQCRRTPGLLVAGLCFPLLRLLHALNWPSIDV